ncbi:MAG: hypothetical protein ACOX02_05770 [Acholeplasmatales bacterium]
MIRTKKDLEKIRAKQMPLIKMREGKKRFRIVVALGEENISAKETLNEFIKVLDELEIFDCAVFFGPKSSINETPVVEIHGKNTSITYINATKEVVPLIVKSHIVEGKVLNTHVYKEEK